MESKGGLVWKTALTDSQRTRSQDLDTLTYEDKGNGRNMHKSRSSQLVPFPTDIEDTQGALNAVQVRTSSKEPFLLVNDSEKILQRFVVKPT